MIARPRKRALQVEKVEVEVCSQSYLKELEKAEREVLQISRKRKKLGSKYKRWFPNDKECWCSKQAGYICGRCKYVHTKIFDFIFFPYNFIAGTHVASKLSDQKKDVGVHTNSVVKSTISRNSATEVMIRRSKKVR